MICAAHSTDASGLKIYGMTSVTYNSVVFNVYLIESGTFRPTGTSGHKWILVLYDNCGELKNQR
jgi:hypothetical protein